MTFLRQPSLDQSLSLWLWHHSSDRGALFSINKLRATARWSRFDCSPEINGCRQDWARPQSKVAIAPFWHRAFRLKTTKLKGETQCRISPPSQFSSGKSLERVSFLANVFFEHAITVGMPQFAQCFRFDLADSLTGDVENLTNLFQRFHAPIIQTVAQTQYITLTRTQGI